MGTGLSNTPSGLHDPLGFVSLAISPFMRGLKMTAGKGTNGSELFRLRFGRSGVEVVMLHEERRVVCMFEMLGEGKQKLIRNFG